MRKSWCSVFVLLFASLGIGPGCGGGTNGWTPVLEETSTDVILTEADRAHEHLVEAQKLLRSDPDEADRALRAAESSLAGLRYYYLPMAAARENAYNAYRFNFLGDQSRVLAELESIQGTVEDVAEKVPDEVLPELNALAEILTDARMAVLASPEEAAPILERLARHLNLLVLKGDLVIGSG